MRAAAIVIVLASATAWADRTPVISVGGVMDLRFRGDDWKQANEQDKPSIAGGPRVTLTYEDALMPKTPMGTARAQLRLVPELFAGAFLGSDVGEAYAGAGLRGELALAAPRARLGMYLAARGLVIGLHRDGAGELGAGEYIQITDTLRLGFEGAAVVRPQDRGGDRELDCLVDVYVGWRR
jgi:hypothetical protein